MKFGQQLRELRGARSLRDVERAVAGVSRSELQRVERGVKVPAVEFLERLGDYYGVGAALVEERDQHLAGQWHPSRTQSHRYAHRLVHSFPAAYSGEVWVKVTPSPTGRDQDHNLTLKWGPWERTLDIPVLGPDGAVLVFAKGDDGLSVPVRAEVNPVATLVFGVGSPPSGPMTDINPGWTWTGT